MYKVMIVDDAKYIRKSIKNRIAWEKLSLLAEAEAGNGKEALERMKELRPDIVLVDIRMPVMDGLTFIREAKKLNPRCSYIIMSAYSDFEYAKEAIKLGVIDYILKPIEEEELEALLKKIVHRLNENRLVKQVQRMDVESVDEVLLSRGKVAALAFYIETDMDVQYRIEETADDMGAVEGMETLTYCLQDYSREYCFVYLLNGDQLTEAYVTALAGKVLEHFPESPGKGACSRIVESANARWAARESIRLLKYGIFCPERKILTEQVCTQPFSREQSKAIWARLSDVDQRLMSGEHSGMTEELEEIVQTVICGEYSIGFIEEAIAKILKMTSYFEEDDTDFNIIANRFQSKDYLLAWKDAQQLKEDLSAMIRVRLEGLEGAESREEDIVVAIKRYVSDHYTTNLNVSDIAQRFYLNDS